MHNCCSSFPGSLQPGVEGIQPQSGWRIRKEWEQKEKAGLPSLTPICSPAPCLLALLAPGTCLHCSVASSNTRMESHSFTQGEKHASGIPLKWSTEGTCTYILHGYVLYPQALRQKSPSATRSEGWAPCRKVWIQYRTWRHLHSSFDLTLLLLLRCGTEGSANPTTPHKCSVADVVNWHVTGRLQLCFLLTTVRFLLQCFIRKMVCLQQTFVLSDRHSQADYSGFTERHFLSRRGRQHLREVSLPHCKQTRWFWGKYLYLKVLLYH